MTSTTCKLRYRLFGSVGSPYALKLRSLFRYKQIPFDWAPCSLDWLPGELSHPPLSAKASEQIRGITPRVIPVVYFPGDASLRNESTSIAYELERCHPQKPIIPEDQSIAFLSYLLEDMADEWFVKIAFLWRWGDVTNAAHKSRIVTGELLGGHFDLDVQKKAASFFALRQQSRMPLVGCTGQNKSVINDCFYSLAEVMDGLLAHSCFIFGDSPYLADFGFYGQLQSLATDPTAASFLRARSEGIFPYLQLLDDASAIEYSPASIDRITDTAVSLLRLAAVYYLPYLQANWECCRNNESELHVELNNRPYVQRSFKYHAKCLNAIRDQYRALPVKSAGAVKELLASVGALQYIES